MSSVVKVGLGVVIIALGMVGLHQQVEYSGWVLFAGCFIAVGCA